MEAGIFTRVEFWRFSQNRPPHWVSRTLQNRRSDLHRRGGITEKASSRRKKLHRRMRSCTLFGFAPMGVLVYESGWRSNLGRDRSDPVCETGLTGHPWVDINTSHLPPWIGEPPSHESFSVFLCSSLCSRVRPRSPWKTWSRL